MRLIFREMFKLRFLKKWVCLAKALIELTKDMRVPRMKMTFLLMLFPNIVLATPKLYEYLLPETK